MNLSPLLLAMLCGCTVPRGDIISITQSTIGIKVGENPTTQVPELMLGFVRTTYQVVPTSTNELYAPMVNSSLSLDQKAFSTSIEEDFTVGDTTAPTDSVAKKGVALRFAPVPGPSQPFKK